MQQGGECSCNREGSGESERKFMQRGGEWESESKFMQQGGEWESESKFMQQGGEWESENKFMQQGGEWGAESKFMQQGGELGVQEYVPSVSCVSYINVLKSLLIYIYIYMTVLDLSHISLFHITINNIFFNDNSNFY